MLMVSKRLAFVFRFLIAFILLSFAYQLYLSFYPTLDPFTSFTSKVVFHILNYAHGNLETISSPETKATIFYYNNKSIFQIIEGCNGLSVCISFVSFVIAYSTVNINAILFSVSGTLLTLIINILRICALGVLYINKYAYVTIIHDTLFPATIYGFIVLLWLFWIRIERRLKEHE